VVGAALMMAGVPVAMAHVTEAAVLRTFAVETEPLPLPAALSGLAAEVQPALQSASQPSSQPALPSASAPDAAGALGDASLAEQRGGTETPWSDMRLSGTVGGNSAINVVTGANNITAGAFSNASGLPMVIQNSGANVLIQNATIVNVQIR
jgi:hypothetical protein